ncbi:MULTISPECIES: hypothetical protein [Cylindrospermopsis]|nr:MULTISPECIES: hypothetical protein [Cylindrospermopsis]
MRKHFNTAGPCKPNLHYMLSSVERIPQIKNLTEIAQSPDGRMITVIRG